MRKPWEEAGSHRERFFGDERPRRFDRRFDYRDGFARSDRRDDFNRRSDRRFDRRFDRRDDRFEGNRFGDRPRRSGNRRFDERREQNSLFGVRSGPRARAAAASRSAGNRAYAGNPSRNALITLDADVARVFGSSQAVNEALRHLIALAKIMGPQALEQAQTEEKIVPEQEAQKAEAAQDLQALASEDDSVVSQEPATENRVEDDEEDWFELPEENGEQK